METIEIDDREVVVTTVETRAPAGCLAAANVLYRSIEDIIPELHEAHQRHFGDMIACIDADDPYRTVRVEFTVSEMSPEKMYTIISELIVQADALHRQRMIERSKLNHPSAPRTELTLMPDATPKSKKSAPMRATPRNWLRR